MQRLSYLDAQFLHLENQTSPMHIANIAVFEGPAPSRKEVEKLFEAKLQYLERYRQRVRFLPLEAGRPVWVDDPHFELRYHIRSTALPAPHDDAALHALVGRIMSRLLDRNRPLWEVWVVEGLQNNRWALISKSHHAMVDGASGTDLLGTIMDTDPNAVLPEPKPWTPEPSPRGAALVRSAMADLFKELHSRAKTLREQMKKPDELMQLHRDISDGMSALTRNLFNTRPVSIQGKIGRHRSYAAARAKLEDISLIRKAFGGTVNDVCLGVVSAGHRALLKARGDDPDYATIRSLVPVSLRGTGATAVLGNRVSGVLCDLPVNLEDPVERLHVVSGEMRRLKASHMIEAGAYISSMGDISLSMFVGPMTRFFVWLGEYLPQRAVSTVTTNVPGPRQTLYFLGRKMVESFPFVPISHGARVGTAINSYCDKLSFGVTADYDALPDIDVFVRAIESDLAELLRRAKEKLGLDRPAPREEESGVRPLPAGALQQAGAAVA